MNHSEELKKILDALELPYYDTVDKKEKQATVYADGKQKSNGNPQVFISIANNGSARTNSSIFSVVSQVLSVSIHIRLSAKGIKDDFTEDFLYDTIFQHFRNAKKSNNYTFQVSKTNIFGGYKNLLVGYSTRIINIDSNFINN